MMQEKFDNVMSIVFAIAALTGIVYIIHSLMA